MPLSGNSSILPSLKLASQPVTPLIKVKPLFSFSAGMGLATL